MKKLFAAIITFFLFSNVISQTFENDWIVKDQRYFRIPIIETGIYRMYNVELNNAGIPVSNIIPQNIQMFYKGIEQAIYVKQDAGILDFVEFFAEKNDGWFDTALYVTPDEQTNPYYSLINDTSSYYFTWEGNSFNNKRLSDPGLSNFNDYEALEYCLYDTLVQYTSRYFYGIIDPEYRSGEGWFDNKELVLGEVITKNIITHNVFSSGPNAKLFFAIVGFSSYNHHLNVSIGGNSIDTIYSGLISYKDSIILNSNLLSNNTQVSFRSINDQMETTDKSVISYIRLIYPKTFAFGTRNQIAINLPHTSDSINLIEFSGISIQPILVYNLQKQTRSLTSLDGTNHKVLIPVTDATDKIILFNPNLAFNPDTIYEVTFSDFEVTALNQEFIIISNSFLWDQSLEYAAYRNAILVDVEELYHQFAYGIRKHPLAIRNFMNYLYQNSNTKPEYLLLLGKGIENHQIRKSPGLSENCLIPVIGNPPGDNMFTAGLDGTNYEPLIPTGRIAAKRNAEIRYYLNKVKEFENNEPAEWMKQILHFGGGSTTAEQQTLANYLSGFEKIIEDTLFGGFVSTFLKNSSEPIENTISDTIQNLINTGVSMLTFFGHAAASGFDQNIDDPKAYENKGKYPFLLANSCLSGNIHLPSSESVSERWVLIENKGVIGFLASTYRAYASDLVRYSTELYKNIAYKSYNQSIGKIIQQTVIDYAGDNTDNINIKNTSLQFTLHGDPSIILNSHALPDFKISGASVFTVPQHISTEIDSFSLKIVVTNIGKVSTDTIAVNLTRFFPDGSSKLFYEFLKGSYYKDTLNFRIDVNRIKGTGLNRFVIDVDANNFVDELNELNNSYQTNIFIRTNDLTPVSPYKESIYPDDTVTLIVSTGDPFNELQQSRFQIDTSNLFNNILADELIEHSGGVVKWKVEEQLQENQVYFWRTSKVPEQGNYNWNSSSFTYIPDKNGWAQSHYGQFEKNNFISIQYNSIKGEFEFIDTRKRLHCHNVGTPYGNTDYYNIEYTIDLSGDYSSCWTFPKIHIVIIDSMDLTPWHSERNDYGHWNYQNSSCRSGKYFQFASGSSEHRINMANMLNDSVPDGNYILAYSFNTVIFSQWEDNIFKAFETLGATKIRTVGDSIPYIFFAKKGDKNSAIEVKGDSATAEIDLNADLENSFYYGEIETKPIGPSSGWDTLSWMQHSVDAVNSDIINLSVKGITPSGQTEILFNGLGVNDYEVDLSGINAELYPYLQLKFFTQDSANHTPAQLDYWQIEFTGVPELAIDPSSHFEISSDTLQEGEQGSFSIAINNISPYDADSVHILYWIYDNNLNYIALDSTITSPVLSGEYVIDTTTFPSMNLIGRNQLWIEINPSLSTGGYAMQEQYHFNNIAQFDYYVEPDKTNPILDVTFDGVHIMNGDIVSAKPEILITLSDENKYIPLNDTSLFTLHLKSAEDGEKRIYFTDNFGNDILNWTPASLPDNNFKIIYNPVFEKDGIYELKVQAKDETGNYSGYYDYNISFEIINKSTITNIYNYPNPFTTSTRFVFELTGSEIPDDFRIQIITVTGKLVREISLEELGPLHIGKNISDFAWDGTDMFGDRLANGVYFYRVFTKLAGEKIERRESAGDSYFQKGFGKMYLIR